MPNTSRPRPVATLYGIGKAKRMLAEILSGAPTNWPLDLLDEDDTEIVLEPRGKHYAAIAVVINGDVVLYL